MLDVAAAERVEQLGVERLSMEPERVVEDDPIRSSGDGDTGQAALVADDLFTRAVHRAHAGAAGQHERPIDIEKDQSGRVAVLGHR